MADDTERQIQALEQANPLREPVLRAAIAALPLAPGSRGLDMGCGTGRQAVWLAEATQPDGEVVGLDISTQLLAYAAHKVKDSPHAGRISFREGDMIGLTFGDNTFDWVWSADCAGYPAGDLLPVLREIARVLRPGGTVALLGWSSQQLLPGHSQLEARLNATSSAYAPFLAGKAPESHFLRALHWFPEAGFVGGVCRTFVGQVQAPLTPDMRTALTSLFAMLWDQALPQAAAADRAEFWRLCSPQSSDFILDVPEYCGFFTYTMFSAAVAKDD